KPHGDHRGTKDSDIQTCGGVRKRFRDGQMPGDNNAGDMLFAELHTTGLLFGFRQAFEIARLGVSKYLNTFAREVSKKTGKRQTRAIDGRFADFSFEAESGSNQFE